MYSLPETMSDVLMDETKMGHGGECLLRRHCFISIQSSPLTTFFFPSFFSLDLECNLLYPIKESMGYYVNFYLVIHDGRIYHVGQ